MDKEALRLQIKLKLSKLSSQEHSRICKELTHQVIKFLKSQKNQSQVVASFLPMKGEVAPDPIILKDECPSFIWVYPTEQDGKMKFAEASGELGTGPWLKESGRTHEPRLLLIPGLAFDYQGHRLGRGRSFYDQYLSEKRNLIRIGVTWSEQIVDQVPVEEHDQIVNEIITEQGRWSVSGQCFIEGE